MPHPAQRRRQRRGAAKHLGRMLIKRACQLEEARSGGASSQNLETTCILLGLMATVFCTSSTGFPCCEAARHPHEAMAQCGENLHELKREAMAVLEAANGGQDESEAFNLLTSILLRLPRREHIAAIAVDVRVPWCPCDDCVHSFLCGPRVVSCRHCCAIMAIKSRQP